ncbi:MAG: ribose-phosphate pyrophosphokinase [Bacteroidota bacterium]
MSTSPHNEVKIFSGRNSRYLAEKIAAEYGKPLGDLTISQFSDGEIQPSINESVRGCDVFFVQSTFPNADNLLELLLMIDAAKRASAHYITAVIPYFGMARQDRKDKPRVSIGSKVVADLLTAVGASRVMTMDLHAPQIQGFFEIPVDHLDSSVIFIPYIREMKESNLIMASPDMGSSNRTRTFARALNLDMVICDKERKRANEIASMTLIGDVAGKDVIMIDDIIDTGNTLAKSAQMLKDKGALSVRAMCTHPVLSGKAFETIENSCIDELVVCDTIPLKHQSPKIKVLSVAELFSNAIKNVTEFGSISSLFTVN